MNVEGILGSSEPSTKWDRKGCSVDVVRHQERPIRVQIVQPLLPAYRVPLFRKLAEHDEFHVKVLAARSEPRTENLQSVETESEYADLEHPFKGFFGNRLLWQCRLRLDPKMSQGDVLVLSGNLRFLSNIRLMLKAKRRKVGVIWWAHGFSAHRTWLKDVIGKLIVRLSDVRLLYTDAEVEEYRRMGFAPDKLFATNNAIDQQAITDAMKVWPADRLNDFKRREQVSDKNLLLFCGRRTKSISLETVLAALARLKRADKKYCFVIIGSHDSNGRLDRKATELGLNDCVRWLGPVFDQHDLAPWFLSACCLVYPGPIGLSLLHAFSYALPVVVPRSAGHGPEIAALHEGENGLMYRDGDAADLANKISAMSNHAYRQKLGHEALRTVMTTYNMDMMVSRYVSAIKAASRASMGR